ncbi:MAG: efflux RND transporter periplasmic adaptor subunit [Prevotella sp.]|nr:efflux RND transporter periplasmic adaptor subunit [Prevotella sp.]
MNNARMLMAIGAATLLTACGGGGGGRPTFGDNEYPVTAAQTKQSELKQTFPATIKGQQDVEIRPKVAGFITQVCVKEGQHVSAGQTLFVIDNETYQAQVRSAQAAVNTAQAQLHTVELTYENSRQLHQAKVIGDFELQTAQNNLESAKAQLAQAQAALASAKETLSYCYVKSPASGVVGSLPYKVGAMVSSGSTPALTTVSDNAVMEVYFSMTEKAALEMSKAEGGVNKALEQLPDVRLQLADGSLYNRTGRVVKASGVVDAATGSVQMIARFDNPDRLLKSGSSGAIVLPQQDTAAVVIAQNATMEVQNKMFVYTLGEGNKVRYTEITVDPQNDGNNYIVRSGLKPGDKYVTNGLTKLSDGMEIVPITPERYQEKIKEQAKAMTAGDIVSSMKK